MDVEDFPFTVKVNTFMEIGGTSSVDMGRCSAYFSLELKKLTGGSFRVLYAKAELVAEPESNDPLFSVCDDPIGLSKVKIGADHKYSTFVFDNIKLKPNTIYRATLSISAAAYSTFTFEDDSSESWASGWMDPSFSFASDFQYPDDYVLYFSPGVITEDGANESDLTLSIEQEGEQVDEVNKDKGLVTVLL